MTCFTLLRLALASLPVPALQPFPSSILQPGVGLLIFVRTAL
jgi:hypothetical protein